MSGAFLCASSLLCSPQKAVRRGAREFLDEEAELSEEGEAVSSDEEEEEEQDHSLAGFVVDHTQLSQGLNGVCASRLTGAACPATVTRSRPFPVVLKVLLCLNFPCICTFASGCKFFRCTHFC